MKLLFPALLCLLLVARLPKRAIGFSTSIAPTNPKLEASFEIDTVKAFSESSFPIKPEDLIERAKLLFSPEIGLGLKDGGDCLAEDFQFTAAVVGPIGKQEFLSALSSFRLEDSFTIQQNAFGFVVSPVQTNRVYFITNNVAQLVGPFMGVKPENFQETLILPPQCVHVDFDENLKVKEFGFYTVDRQYGNTGGLGGAFGFFYGVGKPLPFREAQPFKRSLRFRLINLIGRLGGSIAKGNKK